jgi:hypothetical protein
MAFQTFLSLRGFFSSGVALCVFFSIGDQSHAIRIANAEHVVVVGARAGGGLGAAALAGN